ncbi:MAG: hypothetical protein O8C66_09385 [Candidatus Methanoperedens sp.]|nr:hypothetical protein [Candidatus Methanoperedens sp.]MCZ7370707.1 hypothetical protein [Candidatus Methanoperedens sp.]
MNKFNLILIVVSTVLLSMVASAQSNYLVTESAPVFPGDTTYVYVPIQNMGFGTFMEDVSARLEPKDNASANSVTILDDAYSLGTINNWGDQRTAKFRIHINPDATEGEYYFNVYITYKGQQMNSGTQQTPVTTKLEDQILTIKGKPLIVLLNSTLGTIAPMSINKETLQFKNTGTGTLQSAVAGIDLTGTNSAFSILGAGTLFSLGNLKAGDEADITFDLAVDIAAHPGVYNLPITITGLNNYSSDNFVGLVVAGTTNFEISYQETLGSFSLNVANVGISPASAVTVTLPRQKNFSSTGSSSSVLGNLNPGDYTSAIFQIAKIPGAGNGLEVYIQYTDTSGQRQSITKYLPVELSQSGTQTRSASTNYTTWLFAAIVILAIYWQRRKITTYFQKQKGR